MPAVQKTILTGPLIATKTGFVVPFIAFKFDGDSTVKMTCLVDLCDGFCQPV